MILDVWTDGMISRALDRDITIPQSDLFISETEKIVTEEKESAYIEKIEESYEDQVTDLLDFIKMKLIKLIYCVPFRNFSFHILKVISLLEPS